MGDSEITNRMIRKVNEAILLKQKKQSEVMYNLMRTENVEELLKNECQEEWDRRRGDA